MRDPGEMATMQEKRHTTKLLQQPQIFGDVVHFGIVYGSGTYIVGERYALWFVDRRYKHTKKYPLNCLASYDLLKALRLLCRDMGGRYLDKMMGDRDFKVIGGQVATDLQGINEDIEEKDQSVVTHATAGRQNQNSPTESKRRHVITIVHNWLTRN